MAILYFVSKRFLKPAIKMLTFISHGDPKMIWYWADSVLATRTTLLQTLYYIPHSSIWRNLSTHLLWQNFIFPRLFANALPHTDESIFCSHATGFHQFARRRRQAVCPTISIQVEMLWDVESIRNRWWQVTWGHLVATVNWKVWCYKLWGWHLLLHGVDRRLKSRCWLNAW